MTDIVERVTDELLAHGEFSANPNNNRPNAREAAKVVVEMVTRAASEWRDISTAPRDGLPVELWHRVWCCQITVQWQICFSDLPWIEKTKTTAWPMEAFSHWRPAPVPPQRNEVKK